MQRRTNRTLFPRALAALFFGCSSLCAAAGPEFSGVYPALAFFNDGNECGIGAVVPWQDRLWVVTYPPHAPNGSDDKLYEIDENLNVTVRPESAGGTHANRMIHRESGQLFIGPYAVDRDRNVRVIPPASMPGRLTGTARHLLHPEELVYFASMEEGFYEVDVHTLTVREIHPDANSLPDRGGTLLPGYHGKGLHSGQGVLVYANNGENSPEAMRRPDIESGCLAEWDGRGWRVVRRNQFTEVTGPGGIYGGGNPATDPLWSVGWDHRSLLLMLRDAKTAEWRAFRLPKASHSYDGAHGWNTEWPRIRDIGEADLLMTMHGMFWRFPAGFGVDVTAGIAPRSTYLKVVGDFCRWGDRIVLGCDDSARSEFMNKRRAKGEIAAPGRSHSNLRFIAPEKLDGFGPPAGWGAVWMRDRVSAGDSSDPFLFSGFARRGVHLAQECGQAARFVFEVDRLGDGQWTVLDSVEVPANGHLWRAFAPGETGAWVRIRSEQDCPAATASFHYSSHDPRDTAADPLFDGLAPADSASHTGGLLRAGEGEGTRLQFAATTMADGQPTAAGYYEMGADMRLVPVDAPGARQQLCEKVAVPAGVLEVDAASVLCLDDAGNRFRLPKGNAAFDRPGMPGGERVAREVCTERDLFNAHGTFYELPAENAGGLRRIRPVATHNRRITDYCSWRGLLVLAGIAADAPAENTHIIRSEDGQSALWVGEIDDLWKLGKPAGHGGPWKDSPVAAGAPSDPYLMNGYDRKSLELSHDAKDTVRFTMEIDITGDGWVACAVFDVAPGECFRHEFPEGFGAYWARFTADRPCKATAWLVYE